MPVKRCACVSGRSRRSAPRDPESADLHIHPPDWALETGWDGRTDASAHRRESKHGQKIKVNQTAALRIAVERFLARLYDNWQGANIDARRQGWRWPTFIPAPGAAENRLEWVIGGIPTAWRNTKNLLKLGDVLHMFQPSMQIIKL